MAQLLQHEMWNMKIIAFYLQSGSGVNMNKTTSFSGGYFPGFASVLKCGLDVTFENAKFQTSCSFRRSQQVCQLPKRLASLFDFGWNIIFCPSIFCYTAEIAEFINLFNSKIINRSKLHVALTGNRTSSIPLFDLELVILVYNLSHAYLANRKVYLNFSPCQIFFCSNN